MIVFPAHDDLQYAVQLAQSRVLPHLYPPPDGRMGVLQNYLELSKPIALVQVPNQRLFGPKAAAKYLGICEDTLKKTTQFGQVKAFNMNGRRAYRLEDLEAFVESLPEWYDSTGEKSAKVVGDRRVS